MRLSPRSSVVAPSAYRHPRYSLERLGRYHRHRDVPHIYLFDGIDHPLRIKQGATTAYYEMDLAGNVRALRASGGASLGQYRFTAFGKTVEDTASVTQPLRWKGRWHSVAGSTEIYDVRARQWVPEMGVFLTIDEYEYHDTNSTLWGWPRQNPTALSDPTGRGADEVSKCMAAGGSLLFCLWHDLNKIFGPTPPPPMPLPFGPEFPRCGKIPSVVFKRFCCAFTCDYDPSTGKRKKSAPKCPAGYRDPDPDRTAEACYERCLTESGAQ